MAVVGVCCEPVSVDFPVIGKYTGKFHAFRQILAIIRLQHPIILAILFLLGTILKLLTGNTSTPEEVVLVVQHLR